MLLHSCDDHFHLQIYLTSHNNTRYCVATTKIVVVRLQVGLKDRHGVFNMHCRYICLYHVRPTLFCDWIKADCVVETNVSCNAYSSHWICFEIDLQSCNHYSEDGTQFLMLQCTEVVERFSIECRK